MKNNKKKIVLFDLKEYLKDAKKTDVFKNLNNNQVKDKIKIEKDIIDEDWNILVNQIVGQERF